MAKNVIVFMLFFFFAFLLIIEPISSLSVENSDFLVKVYVTGKEQSRQLLAMGFDVIEFNQNYLKLFVTKDELLSLTRMNMRIEKLDLSDVVDPFVIGKRMRVFITLMLK